MNKNVLVSIIVPIYNAGKYVEKCLTSIQHQSYGNIEIIMVDDGSQDNSGEVAVEFAEHDSRFCLVKKENEGVSAARNVGIEVSKGDYIMFVDADDFLASDFIEYMLGLAEATGAAFCLTRNCFTQKGESQVSQDPIDVLTPQEATALLLSPEVIVGCWNKIYRHDFIVEKGLRFATNLFYGEGLHFIVQAAQLSGRVGVGNRKVYYYRRNNEHSATTKFDIEKFHNGEKSLKILYEQLQHKNLKVETIYTLHRSLFSLSAAVKILSNKSKMQYKIDYVRWISYLRQNTPRLLLCRDVSLYRKLLLLCGCISPALMAVLDAKRRKSITNNSVQ